MPVSRRRLMAFLAAAVASGCTAPSLETQAASVPAPTPQAYPAPQRGDAVLYHRRHTGRRMANGQPFQPESYSAAHRTLPFGTAVRVTNLRTGASSVVVIRDRGPFTPGRIIDLSPRSARAIGAGGVTPVELVPVGLRWEGSVP